MVLKSTLDYIAQPLETADINMLRNAAVCGITALVIVMVGLSRLLILVFYLLVISIITAVTWLYSIEYPKRVMVIQRIKEVFNSFMQSCVDDVLKKNTVKKTAEHNCYSHTEDVLDCGKEKEEVVVKEEINAVERDLSKVDRKPQITKLNEKSAIDYSRLFE